MWWVLIILKKYANVGEKRQIQAETFFIYLRIVNLDYFLINNYMSRVFQLFFLFTGLLFCEYSLWSQDTISLAGQELYADMLGSASSSL